MSFPSCSGLYVRIDLQKYLNPVSFEEEKRLADTLFQNGADINAGSAFNCAEPSWYKIIFASNPAIIKIGELTCVKNHGIQTFLRFDMDSLPNR